jgi:hypothetical protein
MRATAVLDRVGAVMSRTSTAAVTALSGAPLTGTGFPTI